VGPEAGGFDGTLAGGGAGLPGTLVAAAMVGTLGAAGFTGALEAAGLLGTFWMG